MPKSIRIGAIIARKDPRLPRFVVVPSDAVKSWKLTETTTVTGSINGHDMGRRSIKKWDEERWFIELPQPLCQEAGVDTGDRVELTIQIASDELPDELATLIAADPRAKSAWERLTPGSRRMLREHVADAKQSTTRARRAAAGLGV
jgi:hypothetical protein